MNISKEENGHPCPCYVADPVPAQELGNAPKTLGKKKKKLVYILCSIPDLPVDFLQQQPGLKNR